MASPARKQSLNIIVAATHPGLGIGKGGSLPWPMLKGEMGFFSRVTKRTGTEDASAEPKVANAVIMGRKTWDSIPEKFRPLKDRVNLVVSSSMQQPALDPDSFQGPYVCKDLPDSLHLLQSRISTFKSQTSNDDGRPAINAKISRTFIIGGASLYEAALKMNACDRVLLTKILKPFDCDVHFPIDPEKEGWQRRSTQCWAEWTGELEDDRAKETKREEAGVSYEFCLYERGSANS